MTTNAILATPDQRAPIYLVEFQRGPDFFRYTTATDEDKVFFGRTYVRNAVAVSRLGASVSEGPGGEGTIILADDDPVVQIFDAFLPTEPVTCLVQKYEQNDPDMQIQSCLSGEVAHIADREDGTSELQIKPAYQSFNRSIPWQVQQETCVLGLYSVQCGVSAEAYRVSATGAELDGLTIRAAEWDTDATDATYFQAGYVKCRRTREVRFVLQQEAGGVLRISYPFVAALSTDIFDAFAGCQRTGDVCKNKFNNKINFMGFEKIPTKNMFKTGIK